MSQAEAVRAVREHVHGVGNPVGRERRGEPVAVFGRDVGVFGGVPYEERRRQLPLGVSRIGWAWMNFTWFASAYDNDDDPYRLLTMVLTRLRLRSSSVDP